MRHFGGIGLVIGLIAVACAGASDTTTTPSPAASTTASQAPTSSAATTVTSGVVSSTTTAVGKARGGEVVIGDDQEPPTLNPYASGGDNFITRIIGQAHQVGVWDIDGITLERIPDVVTELPTVANGGVVVNDDGTMTVRYEIRDEAVWADGVPISGTDLQFTYEAIVGEQLAEVGIASNEVYASIVSTDVGAKTFAATFSKASILHESLFRIIIPAHDVAGSNLLEDWNDRAWVAGGPFEVSEWTKGQQLTLTRNPNYWKVDPEAGQQLPYLDTVVFRFIPETEALIRAFRAREVDVIQPPPAIDTIANLRALVGDGASVSVRSGPVWEHLNFQFGPRRLDRNPESMNEHLAYRQAVAHLVDREAIVGEVMANEVDPLGSYIDAFTPPYAGRGWQRYEYDPAVARTLIDDLCLELERDCEVEPLRAVFSTTSNADMRPRVAGMLEVMFDDVGIDFTQELEDSQLFFGETLETGNWDLGQWAWVGSSGLAGLVAIHDVFDPDNAPAEAFQSANFYRWGTADSSVIDDSTARFAEVVDLMNATVDEAALRELIAEAEEILADQVVIIPLFARPTVGVVWADEIGGYTFNPSDAGHTWNIETWYRADN